MQSDVRLRRAVAVQELHLMGFGHPVLAALHLAVGSHGGLMGRGDGRGQVRRSDLLRHQLLLDFIDQD